MAENVKIVIKAFDKTAKGFGTVGKGLARITGSIVSMRSALILAAGVGGFGYMIKSSLNATDSLKKTADKIGTTTAALSGLRFAAEISGVEVRTMDMALQRFTRRTAEAAKGTGEAKSAIKELGIDAKVLNSLPLDERMLILADAFGKVRNDSDKLRLAFKLFDSEGAALVNTLGLGREGLEGLLGEAKLLGLTMSQSAAVGVEKANDSITKLLSISKGLKDQFSAALAPAIESVVTQLSAFFLAIAEDEGGVEKWARGMAVSVLESVLTIAKGLDTTLRVLSDFGNKAEELLGFDGAKEKLDKNIAKMKSSLVSLGKEIGDMQNEDFTFGSVALDLITFDSINKKVARFEALKISINDAEEALKNLAPEEDIDLGSFLNIDKFTASILAMIQAVESGGSENETFVPKLTKDLTLLEETFEGVKQGFKDWQQTVLSGDEIVQAFTKNALNGMTNSFTAAITGAADFADAMKAMAKSVVDSLIKMLIQKYIVDAAFGAITGFIGSSSASGTNGMIGGGSGTPSFDARAHVAIGGPLQSGSPYLVGERGPELFVPNSQGSIVPNKRLGGSGGVTVNQVINISTGVQQTVRAEIATLMPQIASAAKGAVADARQRGGGFSKALVGA